MTEPARPAAAPAPDPAAGTGVAAELAGLGQLVSSLEHDGRTGWKTTEFWTAIMTWLLPILTLIFHRDLSSLAVPLAVVAAGAAQAAYTISRAITKKGHATALASMAAIPAAVAAAGGAAPAVPGPAGLTGSDGAQLVQAMTAALAALTAAVQKLSA